MPTWTPPPQFATGQFLSAEAHLNGLARSTEQLLAMYLAREVPFPRHVNRGRPEQGWEGWTPDGWRRVWAGFLRHKVNTLRYRISYTADVVTGLRVRIQWHNQYTTVVAVTGGSGVANGTINVASLSYNMFYPVNVEVRAYHDAHGGNIGQGSVTVEALYEEAPQTYAALASFNAGTTPTAAQWQALSDRASLLRDQLAAPRAVFQGGICTGGNGMLYVGTFRHKHRYWYYDIRVRPPYGDGTVTVKIGVHNTAFTVATRNTPADRYPAPHQPDEGDTEYDFWTHRGVLDVNSLDLTEGTEYVIWVGMEITGDATIAAAKVFALWQQTPATPSLPWWEPMPSWQRGSTVGGAGNVKTIRNNLEDLSERITYRNYPSVQRYPEMPPAWNFRYHRFLHYFCEPKDNAAPKLGYWAGDRWEEVSLPYEPNRWLSYDLNSARRLFEGTAYRLTDIMFALEDEED